MTKIRSDKREGTRALPASARGVIESAIRGVGRVHELKPRQALAIGARLQRAKCSWCLRVQDFVHRKNLDHYRKLLAGTPDEAERALLVRLLAEEEAKELPPLHKRATQLNRVSFPVPVCSLETLLVERSELLDLNQDGVESPALD